MTNLERKVREMANVYIDICNARMTLDDKYRTINNENYFRPLQDFEEKSLDIIVEILKQQEKGLRKKISNIVDEEVYSDTVLDIIDKVFSE